MIERLFARFAAAYGHIWRSQFKTDEFLKFAKKEWAEALSRFSDKTIDEATTTCERYFEKPPTLPEMMSCCRQIQQRFEFDKKWMEEARSTHKQANPDVARFHLERLKKILNMTRETAC